MSVALADDKLIKQEMALMRYQCPSWVMVPRGCGHVQWVQAPCSNPTCITCQKIRAERIRNRWYPVLLEMRKPRLMTLTVSSTFDLRAQEQLERESFRRLLDTRLGARAWPRLRHEAEAFLDEHFAGKDGPKVDKSRARQLRALKLFGERIEQYADDRWLLFSRLALTAKLSLLFLPEHRSLVVGLVAALNVLAKEVRKGVWPRVRDFIGPGLSSRETTWGGIFGWHLHRHVCYDGEFFPWCLLVACWRRATKGEGEIADIRALRKEYKSMLEVVKYTAKAWDIPDERVTELIEALKNKKRVWPLGGASPVEPDHTCPECHCPECEAGSVRMGRTMRRFEHDEREVHAIILHGYTAEDEDEHLYLEHIEGAWRRLDEYEALKYIQLAFACHSRPRDGPDVSPQAFDTSLLEAAYGSEGDKVLA